MFFFKEGDFSRGPGVCRGTTECAQSELLKLSIETIQPCSNPEHWSGKEVSISRASVVGFASCQARRSFLNYVLSKLVGS